MTPDEAYQEIFRTLTPDEALREILRVISEPQVDMEDLRFPVEELELGLSKGLPVPTTTPEQVEQMEAFCQGQRQRPPPAGLFGSGTETLVRRALRKLRTSPLSGG